jgi:tetratricopeptide (TPR) repeat protein
MAERPGCRAGRDARLSSVRDAAGSACTWHAAVWLRAWPPAAGPHAVGRANAGHPPDTCRWTRAVATVVALAAATAVAGTAGCAGAGNSGAPGDQPTARVEALSLLGRPLFAPEPQAEARARMEAELTAARIAYDEQPNDADAIIWLGRRLAYLGRFREAIDVFSEGIVKHPADARMYRHRGHRFITTRQLVRAIADLEAAVRLVGGTPDEVEPDGQPNRYGIPVGTLQTNIWYHLALAHYLRHDFEQALPAWRTTLALAQNDDMVVAASDWLYMTLRRMGRDDEAAAVLEAISPGMRILENDAYHRRLLMYQGAIPPDSLMPPDTHDAVQLATYGYGLANWYLYTGDRLNAETLFRRIVQGPNWAAFGYIAAEAELAGGGR